jgi:hypothetical protein
MGKWIVSLVDTSKLAGWVRAGVAGIITLLVSKYLAGTIFAGAISPDIVNALAVLAGTAVVGLWQWIAKKLDPDYSKPSP